MQMSDKEFQDLSTYIKINFGINLSEKKRSLLMSRLSSLLQTKSFNSLSEYYDYVVSDNSGIAISDLVDKITTNHTYFYREKKHFDYLWESVLPEIVEKQKSQRDIRIWSAGCSSGEEPYTIAMLLIEYFSKNPHFWDKKLLATDISSKALKIAKKGIYEEENIMNLPTGWKNKYFKKEDDEKYKVKDSVRKEVIYRRLNLMSPFSFKKKMHVIFCRNVMIYFDNETTNYLVNQFYNWLEPGGYLFISHSESLDRRKTNFRYVRPSIYRKD